MHFVGTIRKPQRTRSSPKMRETGIRADARAAEGLDRAIDDA